MIRRLAVMVALLTAGAGAQTTATRHKPPSLNEPAQARSEETLRKAIAEGGDTAELHGELGLLLYRGNRFHEAILELGRAAQLDPSAPEYSLKLAASIVAERRYSVALEFLRSIAQKFENHAEYQYNL